MRNTIYISGEKGNKLVDGRLRVIEPIGILGDDFNLGYFDHSTVTVVKDVDGKVISETPEFSELPSKRLHTCYDNNLFVIYRGIRILERLPELREHTLYATYLLACESDKRFKPTIEFGRSYKPGRDEIERLRKLLRNETIAQIFSEVPDLESLVKDLLEKKIPLDTESLREVVESGRLLGGDYIKLALAR